MLEAPSPFAKACLPKNVGGELPYDLLLRECDPELVQMELDIYWITKAGYDPINYFNKVPGRYPLWHIKDMDDNERQFFTEVGEWHHRLEACISGPEGIRHGVLFCGAGREPGAV